jgi:hypothetical protein
LESIKQMEDLCFLYAVKKKKSKQKKKQVAFFQTEDWLQGQEVPLVKRREPKQPGHQNGNYNPVHAEQLFYEAGCNPKNPYDWRLGYENKPWELC